MSDDDKKQQAIAPRPVPGAYLCESTASNADYWLKNGRELPDRDEAVLAVEQAINAWKNLAYGLAAKLHYAGYDPTEGCVPSATAWIPVASRLPDDDITVMIAMKDGDEPVWLGYYDGDCWYSVDAMPIRTRVTHWRPMPEGPTKEDRRATGIR